MWTLALALVCGVGIGLVMGALGGGGAILALPVLVYLLGVEPHAAATSALVVVGAGAAIGAWRNAAQGRVHWVPAISMAALGVLGNLAGSWLATRVPSQTLLGAFGVLLLVVAGLMWHGRGSEPEGEVRAVASLLTRPGLASLLMGSSLLVGALTGFFGVGGGFLIVPALVLLFRFPTKLAIGTSLVVIALNCLVALGTKVGSASVPWGVTAVLTFAAIVGSLSGTVLTERVNSDVLRRTFVFLLLAVSTYTLVRVFL